MAPTGKKDDEDKPTDPFLQKQGPPPPRAAQAPQRIAGFGVLDTFLKDPEVTEIMINDVRGVMLEKQGRLSFSGFSYQSQEELTKLTKSILDTVGRVLSPEQPYIDATLPDGSRINVVGPPLTLNGPCITIRKPPVQRFTMEDLVRHRALDKRIAQFLHVCVAARLNILISGGTGSGKTTLLNALLGFIPKDERLITIEDTPELVLQHHNSVKMQTRPLTPSEDAIGARELVANSLRMRPDRIIIGECRRGEAFDMLQAMNTGHAGSMTSIHANSPRDALARLETLCLMGEVALPLVAIRKQVASALDLVIQVKRFRNGQRHIVAVAEVTGTEGEVITMQDVFVLEAGPKLPNRPPEEQGQSLVFKCTGFVPSFVDRLREGGFEFPARFFD